MKIIKYTLLILTSIFACITYNKQINAWQEESKIINVPYINQNNIVSGCEAVSSTMLLRYHGYDISETYFANNFLTRRNWFIGKNGRMYGPDPNAAYSGNPYKRSGANCGFGCYAPAIGKALSKVINHDIHKVLVTTGINLDQLVSTYIEDDIPVLVWATIGMIPSKRTCSWIINYTDENSHYKKGDRYTWVSREHCLVLVGYGKDRYYFNDPYKNHGVISYSKDLCRKRFNEMGKQSVVITCAQDQPDNT